MNKKEITTRLTREFPSIYFDLQSNDAYGREFQVRGFGAERTKFRSIRRKIMDINDELFPNFDVTLITILFTNLINLNFSHFCNFKNEFLPLI